MTINYPPGMYVRIAEVIRVSFSSRELDIRFLDGDTDDLSIYRAETLFGSYATLEVSEDSTSYIECPSPSAAVIGKGDRVNVIVANEILYVVSKFDTFDFPNSNTVAVYPDKVLLEYLTGLCVDTKFIEDENSHISLLHNGELIKLLSEGPNFETNRIPYRLLKEIACSDTSLISYTAIDDVDQRIVTCGGGPIPVQPLWFNNSMRQGRRINGLPVISSAPYGKTDYTGSLSLYSSAFEDVYSSDSHPLEGPTLSHYYRGESILWFEDDDPEWVLAIAVFPSWELCKYIKFIEIPVYGWSEVALNNADVDDVFSLVEYKRYEKYIREIYTLQRSWIDWNTVASSVEYSDSLHKALIIPAIKVSANKYKFAIQDGFGYSNGSEILFSANKQKLIYGTVERKLRGGSLAPNGSPFDYEIKHDNPLSAVTTVSLWYDMTFRYSTTPYIWESQVTPPQAENESWKCYTDGVNSLFKKIKIDYYAEGFYPNYPWDDEENDGQWDGDVSGLFLVDNNFNEFIYWNNTSNLVCEYRFHFHFTTGDFTLNQSIPVFHYANIEMGLFVIELIQMNLKNSFGLNMPLNVEESSHKRKFIAWFRGSVYNLFEVDLPYADGDLFPPILNFWPWFLDANTPPKPTLPPGEEDYDVTGEWSSIFYLAPFCWYFVEPSPGYSLKAVSYPTFQGDVSSVLFASAINKENLDTDLRSDYLKVTVDPGGNSWSIFVKNVIELTGSRSISFPSGGGSTVGDGGNVLFSVSGSLPQYMVPPVTKTIEIK
jgi:hypothetical protein